MHVQDLIDALESIAPLSAAEPWDKVGLHIGSPTDPIAGPVFLTIDLTEKVLDEALESGASAIIAYHPPIWSPLERLTAATPAERIVRRAIKAGIAVYSPHTALDAAKDGMTEWLCEGLSSNPGQSQEAHINGDCRALEPHTSNHHSREVKIITFVPDTELDQVRAALATAGAGGIGHYKLCSFSTPGTGTFLPQDGAAPTIGSVGSLERVPEHRLEMVCSKRQLPLAIETLKEFHPYEEPAFDIVELHPEPNRRIGAGRRLTLDQPATLDQLAERLNAHLAVPSRMRVGAPWDDASHTVETLGVVCGAGESMLDTAKREGCELFVTGEMKYHEVLRALHMGIAVMLAGHTNTERGYLPRLAKRLRTIQPNLEFKVSTADVDILRRA